MALRVLLADNSETIKKVIQLTLQDFAIDLRIVTLGVDVLDVALKFKPDIIFVDILLQKKSGYEVSKELKNNVQLKNTPVVLMWSGFMEFDEPKAKESLADARLEKPFDADTLKNMVNNLVKKSAPQDISSFLDFPTTPQEKPQPHKVEKNEDPLKSLEKIKNESEKFSQPFELPEISHVEEKESDEFEMQPLDKTTGFGYRESDKTKTFVLDLPEDTNVDDIPLDIESIENVEDMSFLLNPETAANFKMPESKSAEPAKKEAPLEVTKTIIPPPKAATVPMPPPPKVSTPQQAPQTPVALPPQHTTPSAQDIEKMVRAEVREVIEKVAWQIVPELAAELIRKELDRLLKDSDINTKP